MHDIKIAWQEGRWLYFEDKTRQEFKEHKFFVPNIRIYNIFGPYGIGKSSFINYSLNEFHQHRSNSKRLVYFRIESHYLNINGGVIEQEIKEFFHTEEVMRGSLENSINILNGLIIHINIETLNDFECRDAILLRKLAQYPNVYIFVESFNNLSDEIRILTLQNEISTIEVTGIDDVKSFHAQWEIPKSQPQIKLTYQPKNPTQYQHFLLWTGSHPLFYQWLRYRMERSGLYRDESSVIFNIVRTVEAYWNEIEPHIEKFFLSLPRATQIRIKEALLNEDLQDSLELQDLTTGVAVEYEGGIYLSKLLECYLQSPFTFLLYDKENQPAGVAFLIGRYADNYILCTSIRTLLQVISNECSEENIIIYDQKTLTATKTAIDTVVNNVNITGNMDKIKELKQRDKNDLEELLNGSLKPKDEIRFLTIRYKYPSPKTYKSWQLQEETLKSNACQTLVLSEIGPEWIHEMFCKEMDIPLTDNNPVRLYYRTIETTPPFDKINLLPGAPVVSSDQKVIGMVRSSHKIYDDAIQMIPVPRIRAELQKFIGRLKKG